MTRTSLPGAHHVTASHTIQAPIAEVWEVIADYNQMHTWAPSIVHTESISDVKRGVGAVRKNTAKGFGDIEQTVTTWEEGQGYAYRVGQLGPFAEVHTAYWLQQIDAKTTECTLEMGYSMRFGPVGALLNRLKIRGKLAASLTELLGDLQRRVETRERVR